MTDTISQIIFLQVSNNSSVLIQTRQLIVELLTAGVAYSLILGRFAVYLVPHPSCMLHFLLKAVV